MLQTIVTVLKKSINTSANRGVALILLDTFFCVNFSKMLIYLQYIVNNLEVVKISLETLHLSYPTQGEGSQCIGMMT